MRVQAETTVRAAGGTLQSGVSAFWRCELGASAFWRGVWPRRRAVAEASSRRGSEALQVAAVGDHLSRHDIHVEPHRVRTRVRTRWGFDVDVVLDR